jgi:hypothetical protein
MLTSSVSVKRGASRSHEANAECKPKNAEWSWRVDQDYRKLCDSCQGQGQAILTFALYNLHFAV